MKLGRGPAWVNSLSDMAQKVATARKMTRDNLPRPNCDSDGKADNKRQAFMNTDTRRFKIQIGNMDPPPPVGPLDRVRVVQ